MLEIRPILSALALLLAFPAGSAFALRADSDDARPIELASGEVARPQIEVVYAAPASNAAWQHFQERAGGKWDSMWDRETGVPVRIWGSGIEAKDANLSADAAEQFARAFLAEHLQLLAPGAILDDFELAANVYSNGVRSVGFFQMRDGLRVARGQVSLRFKNDRLIAIGSEAFPNLSIEVRAPRITAEQAMQAALRWTPGRFDRVDAPVVRAVVLEDGRIEAAHVIPVIVRTTDPIGRWEVDVDAETGRTFARRQTLMFASGSLKYDVPIRYPRSTRHQVAASLTNITVDGAAARTAADGTITWTSSAAALVTASVVSPLVTVANDAGTVTSTTFSLSDGGNIVWNAADDELQDAQLTAFIAARQARDYMRRIAPTLDFLDDQLPVLVNIADVCNAFSDGTSINFFRSGSGCENTGRLSDVVSHEYGHSIHFHAIIPGVGDFESALSEGGADYLAATIMSDSGMGRGFFFSDEPLRELDPIGVEAVWPGDRGEPHVTGMIFGGAMWDLRKHLIEKYGEEQGVQMNDLLWYGVFQRATSIPSSYVEVLVGNDDDGDLTNGTPDICDITDVFRTHGLASAAEAGLSIGTVTLDGQRVHLPVTERGLCPGFEVASSTLFWKLRGQGDATEVAMGRVPGEFEAVIPAQPEGEVVNYRVVLELGNGEQILFPDNAADPFYEVFIGTVTPIYCTDFESDPMEAGWTHEMIYGEGRRARDEWEWGELNIDPSSGDPSAAYSGNNVVGNDIGLGEFSFGTYQRNKIEEMRTQVIDVSGHQNVRLQYRRWLTIEDGDYDQAEILIGDQRIWTNLASGTGGVHHLDKEWRFHDVDITQIAGQRGMQVGLTFRLTSDDGFQLGGWTIDDFCVVGYDGPTSRCGDGKVDAGEACDDGNTAGADGCEANCTVSASVCGNGMVEAGEQCDDGNAASGDGCDPSCVSSGNPDPEGPKLIKDDGSCGCATTAHTSNTAGGWVFGSLLLIGLLFTRRNRKS